ncbi:MAG TPA: ABC transporter substrate-binding protein, partial [Phototrophicaceae bacterium]|nr:ABC transporter substrate-binding protein [Phototrophicaceae bacterium]
QMIGTAITTAGDSVASIKTELANNSGYDGVQGIYNKTATNAVMLIQAQSNGQLLEAARYDSDTAGATSAGATVCQNCPDLWWADTSDQTIDTSNTFKIGLITTTDGPAASTGDNIEQAARMAVREINDAGGVIGSDNVRYTLVLTTYAATTADEASTVFDQAVQDGMQLIMGPDFNAQILNNLYAAQTASIPQFVSATNSQITADEPANYVFQIRANDTTLVNAAADYLLNVRDLTRFASVAARTDYGLNAIDTFNETVVNSDDGQLVLRLEHDVDAEEADFATLASQISDANVEAVVIWSTQPAAASLLNELAKLNWSGTVVYGYLTPDFATSLTLSDSIEVLGPVNWWDTAGDWASRDFTTRYSERYGEAPTSQSAAYYDGIYLIAKAVAATGIDASQLQTWLMDLESFNGVQGSYTPNTYANGELTRAVEIVQAIGQQIIEIARYDGVTCRAYCGD